MMKASQSIQLKEYKALEKKYQNICKIFNEKVNEILNLYEKENTDQVYKPLVGLVMSLITERQYMAAEGILGHIKSGESGLFK